MSASLYLAHTRSFYNLLDADNATPELKVFNGRVPTAPAGIDDPPYVLLYFSLRTLNGEEVSQEANFESFSDVIIASAYCHSVGTDQEAAISVGGRVRKALLGVYPGIPGRLCYRIKHDDGAPVNRDESTGSARYDLTDVYSFKSLPG